MRQAYGFIETEGLAAAITASDIACKAANVILIGLELTRGCGYTVVKIEGDVAAVKAGVDSCIAAPELSGQIVSVDVIARPSDYLDMVVFTDDNNWLTKEGSDSAEEELPEKTGEELPKKTEEELPKKTEEELPKKTKEELPKKTEEAEETPVKTSGEEKSEEPVSTTKVSEEDKEEKDADEEETSDTSSSAPKTKEELEEMKVVDLRKLARSLETSIPRNKIKYANKDELTTAISEYYRKAESEK